MDDADAMRQRVIDAVNECEDIELLDLIYRILGAEARNGGDISPAAFLCGQFNRASCTAIITP